jgi:hypothetical protein
MWTLTFGFYNNRHFFNILMAIKNSLFWDITPRSPLKINRRFGGICRLHHQDLRTSQAEKENSLKTGDKQSFQPLIKEK